MSVSEKRIVKKGQTHKFYKINPGIFLLPSHTEDKVSDEGILKKIFKEGIKFASIGIVALGYYLFTKPPAVSDEYLTLASQKEINLTIPLLIILVGVISERIFTEIKKKRKPSFNRK
ncbi:hypothetical protein NPIRD3C_0959 [Nitrosopumilus piranensis]|uniref:Uncharacterized protein n=1 Tax=Nitrosopumilus piranensis TaxID=1582439 RepID=A0A0C5BV85_9ARCH|nr:hypothetical protein NPIRD3C_0959 [Nitrosopumilus piranensis]